MCGMAQRWKVGIRDYPAPHIPLCASLEASDAVGTWSSQSLDASSAPCKLQFEPGNTHEREMKTLLIGLDFALLVFEKSFEVEIEEQMYEKWLPRYHPRFVSPALDWRRTKSFDGFQPILQRLVTALAKPDQGTNKLRSDFFYCRFGSSTKGLHDSIHVAKGLKVSLVHL